MGNATIRIGRRNLEAFLSKTGASQDGEFLPGSEIYGLYLKIEDLNLKSIKSGETFITFWGKDLRIFGKVLPL